MATFSATASFSSTAGNLLIGTALSINAPKVESSTKDAGYSNLYIAANSTQKIYESSDSGASTAPLTYIFAQAAAANAANVTIIYTTASTDVEIATLQPGAWTYIPFAKGAHQSSSLSAKAGASAANIAVLYAESMSLA